MLTLCYCRLMDAWTIQRSVRARPIDRQACREVAIVRISFVMPSKLCEYSKGGYPSCAMRLYCVL